MADLQGTESFKVACRGIKDSKEEDPFFILDEKDLCKKIAIWKEYMPRIKPFYSVKANRDPAVLKILANQEIGFEVASKTEMQSVLEQGVDPSRLVYGQPCKFASHMVFAKSKGVDIMAFDNEDELHKIKKLNIDARLLLRVRCDGNDKQHQGRKYGANEEKCYSLLKVANELQLNVIGLSFHVGTEVQVGELYIKAIALCRSILEKAPSFGYKFSILDIGGGFPQKAGELFTTIAACINHALDKYFPSNESIEIIAEPGRFIVGTALSLVTKVMSRRLGRTTEGEIESAMYYINDGVYGSFLTVRDPDLRVLGIPKILREYPISANYTNSRKSFVSTLWGPTLHSCDQLSSYMYLPELFIGDWLYWPDMGDYTLSTQSNFNGYPKAYIKTII